MPDKNYSVNGRIFNAKNQLSALVTISLVASSDDEAVEIAKEMCPRMIPYEAVSMDENLERIRKQYGANI